MEKVKFDMSKFDPLYRDAIRDLLKEMGREITEAGITMSPGDIITWGDDKTRAVIVPRRTYKKGKGDWDFAFRYIDPSHHWYLRVDGHTISNKVIFDGYPISKKNNSVGSVKEFLPTYYPGDDGKTLTTYGKAIVRPGDVVMHRGKAKVVIPIGAWNERLDHCSYDDVPVVELDANAFFRNAMFSALKTKEGISVAEFRDV